MSTANKADAAPEVSKADDAKASKASKKTLTQGDKIAALVKAAKANGWTLPDGLDDDED